jgi:hypothetical protein
MHNAGMVSLRSADMSRIPSGHIACCDLAAITCTTLPDRIYDRNLYQRQVG